MLIFYVAEENYVINMLIFDVAEENYMCTFVAIFKRIKYFVVWGTALCEVICEVQVLYI
jgi:hypothetical protein